jgi:hypothetical protein
VAGGGGSAVAAAAADALVFATLGLEAAALGEVGGVMSGVVGADA